MRVNEEEKKWGREDVEDVEKMDVKEVILKKVERKKDVIEEENNIERKDEDKEMGVWEMIEKKRGILNVDEIDVMGNR